MTSHILLIDSRDRDYSKYPDPNKYRIRLPRTFHDVIGARLMSAEIPRSFHTFSAQANNVSFEITINSITASIVIDDGNYTFASMCVALEKALSQATGLTWSALVSSTTNRLVLLNQETTPFTVSSVQSPIYDRETEWGLLYYLGFEKGTTGSSPEGQLVSPRAASFHGVSYILMDIDELKGADEGALYGAEVGGRPLAKIVVDPGQMGLAILDTSKCLTVVSAQLPRIPRLRELHVTFRYHDGRPVDFNGVDHSFVLLLETAAMKPPTALHGLVVAKKAPQTTHVIPQPREQQQPAPGPPQPMAFPKWWLILALAAAAGAWFTFQRRQT